MSDPANPDNPEAVDEGRPDWLPENFKSPEDLVASYRTAQSKITEQGQTLSALESNYAEMASSFDELRASFQQQPQVDPNAAYSQLQEAYDSDPIGLMARIAQTTAENIYAQQAKESQSQNEGQLSALQKMVVNNAEARLQAENPDYAQYSEQIYGVLKENPNFWSEEDSLDLGRTERIFGAVYKQIKYDELVAEAAGGTPQQQGNTNIDDLTALMKLKAQTASGASGRPDPISDEKAAWDAIKSAAPKTYYS